MNQPSPDSVVLPHSPLIDAYLTDLDTALQGADALERAEVLTTVREHIAAALHEMKRPIADEDVEAILTGLGSVDQLVGALDYAPVLPPGRTEPETGNVIGWPPWVGFAVLTAGALSLPLIVFQPPLAILLALMALTMGWIGSRGNQGDLKRPYRAGAVLGGLTLAFLVLSLLGLLGVESGSAEPSGPVRVPPISTP